MTRAHVESGPSITDALHHIFRSFLEQPELGPDMAPLALHLVDAATAGVPSHRIPAPGSAVHILDTLVESSMRGAIAGYPAAIAPLGELRTGPQPFIRLRQTVGEWVRDGVSLGSVLTLLDRGFDIVFTALAEHAYNPRQITTDMKVLIDVRAAVTTQVVSVFAATDTGAITASSRQAFTTALLAGRTDIGRSRELGLPVFDRYQVVTLSVGPSTSDDADAPGSVDVRQRSRLESAVRRVIGDHALSLLSDAGGTIVVPVTSPDDLVSIEHLAALTLFVEAEIIAARVVGPADAIPEMALRADELLDLAHAIGKPAGIYTMEDLVVEYQLTRPGPAHDRLAALIRPLESNAELLQTLRVHLSCGMNRRETARRLSIHPNTVDNRMSRVSATIGLDLTRPQSIAQTQSAILAFDTAGRRARPLSVPTSACRRPLSAIG